jgi:hypothetical protein
VGRRREESVAREVGSRTSLEEGFGASGRATGSPGGADKRQRCLPDVESPTCCSEQTLASS